MSFKHIFLFVAISSAIVLVAHGGDLCAKTENKGLCRSLLGPDNDPKSATGKTFKKLYVLTKQAKALTAKKKDLSTCVEMFVDILDNINKGFDHLKKGDKGGVQTELSAISTDYSTCEDPNGPDPEAKPQVFPPPLDKIFKLMKDTTSNGLAFAEELP